MDVCVVGHITKDLIRIPGKVDRELSGGTAYYVSVALRSLGLEVGVVTKVAPADVSMLEPLRDRGIQVFNGETRHTTVFENIYTDPGLTRREQHVRSVAAPFAPADLAGVSARAIHLGPLTRRELSLEVIRAARERAPLIALDAQGMLREVSGGRVHLGPWAEMIGALALIDVLKVDDVEAAHLLGGPSTPTDAADRLAGLGPKEVLVTFADRGSLVRSAAGSFRVPAIPPSANVDATGCGDTYAAGYLHGRLTGLEPQAAARFGAATASLKLEGYGPFEGTADRVRAHLANAPGHGKDP